MRDFKQDNTVRRIIRRIVTEEAHRILNENATMNADDIYREVLDQVYNYFGEIEVRILKSDIHIPTPDDYLRAYFRDNTLYVEYNGDQRQIPCKIETVTENPEYVARLIMQGFAKIVYKIA